jgi:hypothetical protein
MQYSVGVLVVKKFGLVVHNVVNANLDKLRGMVIMIPHGGTPDDSIEDSRNKDKNCFNKFI